MNMDMNKNMKSNTNMSMNSNKVAELEFRTYRQLDTPDWPAALALYHRSFPAGRKPDAILAGMFAKGMSELHTATLPHARELAAMAVTGVIPAANLLLIDYLAVQEQLRGGGIGRRFVRRLAEWAREDMRLSGMLLEAEAEPGPDNERRIRFWESCGFTLTDYVHRYRWVPETYRAMYLPFGEDQALREQARDGGRALFRYIESFHKQAFAR